MANGKNKIIFYKDWQSSFEDLTDKEAGILIKHFFKYVNDENPILEDRVIRAHWIHIENTLKRDLKKWEETIEKRSEAGKASAIARKEQKATKSTSVKSVQHNSTKSTVIVNDSVIVKDKVIVNDINKRKTDFKKSLEPFIDKYGTYMLGEFFKFWTQHNEKGKKMKFEYAKNQPFGVSYRLATWLKNQKKFEKEKNLAPKKENAGQLLRKEMGL